MIKLSHDTHKSCKDENGNCHRLCIDPISACRSNNCVTYTAQRFSFAKNKYADDRHGVTCTAKFLVSRCQTKQWALGERKKAEIARMSADIFNELNNENEPRLCFTLPQYASLESVAIFSKRRVGEYVLCEDTLPKFTHFVDIDGKTVQSKSRRSSIRRPSRRKPSRVPDVEADACSAENHSWENAPSELAIPALDMNYLVPTSPPYEEDSPPSYDEIFAPDMNANDQLQTGLGNYNNNFMNYPPAYSPEPTGQENHFSTTSCIQYSRNSVTYGVGGTGTHFAQRAQQETDNLPHPQLRGFIHFDFFQARGQRVVSNLKGTCTNGGKYTLTTPTFHSLTQSHGDRDRGQAGMRSVIDNHVCSSWCRHLPSMHDILTEALLSSTTIMSR